MKRHKMRKKRKMQKKLKPEKKDDEKLRRN